MSIHVLQRPGAAQSTVTAGQGYFPVIASLGGDKLLVVLRGGAGHLGLGGRLDVVRSDDAGATWSEPVTIANSERDDRNPALGVAGDGTIIVAYHWQGSYDDTGKWDPDSRKVDTRIVRSRDGGRTWVEDRLLDHEPLNGASPFGKIRRDAVGTLLMPIYRGKEDRDMPGSLSVDPGNASTRILCSSDHGETWNTEIDVARGLNEADLLMLAEDDWLFAARSEKRDEQAVYTCRSTDRGARWTDLRRVTDAREHPPDLVDLGDGVVLLTCGRRHEPFGVEGRLSFDGGRTWRDERLVFATDLPGTDIGYPSSVLLDSGRLVTVYYRAGTKEKPNDGYNALDAACIAVTCDRDALVSAIGGVR